MLERLIINSGRGKEKDIILVRKLGIRASEISQDRRPKKPLSSIYLVVLNQYLLYFNIFRLCHYSKLLCSLGQKIDGTKGPRQVGFIHKQG